MNRRALLTAFLLQRVTATGLIILYNVIASCLTILLSLSIGAYYEILDFHHSGKAEVLSRFHIQFTHEPTTYFIIFALIILSKMIFQFLAKYQSESLALDFTSGLQQKLFRHQLRMSIDDFKKKSEGSYLLRFTGDINSIRQYLTKGIFRFVSDCLFILISLRLLWILHAKATIVLISALASGFILMHFLNKRLRHIQDKRRNLRSSRLSFINEGFKSLATIKIFNREYATTNSFRRKSDKLNKVNRRYVLFSSLNSALTPGLLFLTLLFIFVICLQSIRDQGNHFLSAGNFTSYIILIILMFPTYKRSLEVSRIWQSGTLAFRKIIHILSFAQEDVVKYNNTYLPGDGRIELHQLSFNYTGEHALFTNLDLYFSRGKINYIEGNYKSTLFKLLTGLYQPTGGKILLDGTNLLEYSKKSVRKNVAMISEDFPLYGNTIIKCLFLEDNDNDRAKAFELLDQLQFWNNKAIRSYDLEQGIGRNGSFLSKSQYKKMLVARAFLSNKKILLIDGVIETLEHETQAEIYRILEALKYTHTIIVTIGRSEKENYLKAVAS